MIRFYSNFLFLSALIFSPVCASADDLELAKKISDSIKGISTVYEISVEVRGDFIELIGFVETDTKIKDIESLIQSQFKDTIINKIKAVPSREDTAGLCAEVSALILEHADKVQVECEGANVILNGKVDSRELAVKVAKLAFEYPGVTGIENYLETISSDELILSDLYMFLKENGSELDPSILEVKESVLTISGEVPSKSALYDLVTHARLVPGIESIVDKTRIKSGAVVTITSINDSMIEETADGVTTTMESKVANKDSDQKVEIYKQ